MTKLREQFEKDFAIGRYGQASEAVAWNSCLLQEIGSLELRIERLEEELFQLKTKEGEK